MKKCPFCAEEIQDKAVVCKHCGRELKNSAASKPFLKKMSVKDAIISIVLLGLVILFVLATSGKGMILILVLVVYFFPTMVAAHYDKRNLNAVTILNLFLGWTLIGWVISLVWAFTKD